MCLQQNQIEVSAAPGLTCILAILARASSDFVTAAKTFYESVFHWKFREHRTSSDGTHHFEAPGQPCPSGGITKVEPSEFVRGRGKGGVVLYLAVDDLKAYAEVCESFPLSNSHTHSWYAFRRYSVPAVNKYRMWCQKENMQSCRTLKIQRVTSSEFMSSKARTRSSCLPNTGESDLRDNA